MANAVAWENVPGRNYYGNRGNAPELLPGIRGNAVLH
jgi:hypothetical protein